MEQFPIDTKVKIIQPLYSGTHCYTGNVATVVRNGPEWDPLLWRSKQYWIRLDSGEHIGTHLLVDHNQIERV